MVLSMTGYGRAEQVLNGRDIVVELRSVNSRFFEYSSRVPRTCSFLEDKLKKLVAAKVSRGKVELNLSIQNVAAAEISPGTVHTQNTGLVWYYRRYLLQKAMSVFKWTLPENWSKAYFLYVLYCWGNIAFCSR